MILFPILIVEIGGINNMSVPNKEYKRMIHVYIKRHKDDIINILVIQDKFVLNKGIFKTIKITQYFDFDFDTLNSILRKYLQMYPFESGELKVTSDGKFYRIIDGNFMIDTNKKVKIKFEVSIPNNIDYNIFLDELISNGYKLNIILTIYKLMQW